MNPFEFFIPQNITVGAGTLAKLPECARKLGGSHAMLISGPTLRKMGVVDKAADYLKDAGMAVDIFTDVEANPSVATVEKATEAYKESGADFIVALGGGSPMDVAKAVGVTAKYGGSITEYEGAHKVPGKIVPLIAIPTTAGTGSEVTAFSVITDHSRDWTDIIINLQISAMICQRIIFCNHREKNCICHSMCHIKESTYRMTHGMDISKSCKGKGDSCKKRACKHCFCCLQICTSCHKTADISTDQLHCFLCHCVRKRRCCCGNISLLRMNKCIDSAGCCHRCRSRGEKLRILCNCIIRLYKFR